MRDGGGVLPGARRDIPGGSENESGELAGEGGLRVRVQLQGPADRAVEGRHHQVHRCKVI